MSDSIKLVIAGLGLVGKRHADAIDKEDDIDLVAIVDPSEDAVNYSNKNNLPIYPSLEDMFLEECQTVLYWPRQRRCIQSMLYIV